MRKLLLFASLALLFSCNEPSQESGDVAKAVTTANKIQSPSAVKDTLKPRPKRNPLSMRDPARDIKDINTVYPFDISLKDAAGDIHNSSDILKGNGKPTVVLFWLTTCYPCRIEMKAIQKEIDKWKAETDFNIVAISTDFEKNYKQFVKRVNESNWSWDSYVDVNREFRKVMPGQLNGLPQSFIFDKDGNIAYHKRKYSTGDEFKLYAKVKELAAK